MFIASKTEVDVAKIIDQRGRVFGLINVIDLSVILLVLSIIPISLFGYLVLTKKVVTRDYVWADIMIKLKETEPEFRDIISKGDVEKEPSGKVIGKLTDISNMTPSKVWVVVDNKMLTTIDHPVRKDILVNAEILCIRRGGVLYHNSDQVKIGKIFVFETDMYNISGPIVGLKIKNSN